MKKIFCIIAVILSVGISYGADKTITSKKYVENQIATKQDKIPAVNDKTVLTHTGTNGNIGEKGIYDSGGDYVSQYSSLLTAGDANTGINNALENEFVCVEEDTDGTCLIWKIKNVSNQQILPNGYTALEYLESTGTQYINTNIWINKSDTAKMDMTAQFNPTNGGWMGANAFIQLRIAENYTCHKSGQGAPMVNIAVGNKDNIVINYENNQETLYVNGQLTDENNWSGLMEEKSLCMIFRLGTYSGEALNSVGGTYGKVYKFSLNINDVLVCNLIPVRRNLDGVLGMYDTVTNTLFTNAGTGEFIAGPELNVYIPSGN